MAMGTFAVAGLAACGGPPPSDEGATEVVHSALGSFNVLTRSYNGQRTGANLSETILNTANVNPNSFGKIFQLPVDDQVYAQPLYASSVAIAGGTFDVLYVATVNNTVYAFNADDGTVPFWVRNFNGAGRPPRNTEVTNGQGCGNYQDFTGDIGIVGTPVIDGATSTMYVVARTLESGAMIYRLHAIDIRTGFDRTRAPVTQIPASPLAGFDPMFQNQRAGLALSGGTVYVAFASYCDALPYHGWVFAFDSATLTRTGTFNTTAAGSMAGIWQGGNAPVLDGSGNVYVMTGNGDWNGTSNFGESLVRLSARSLVEQDFFTPSNFNTLNQNDDDFGSAGPAMLPGVNRLVGGGKDGRLFLLNPSGLGHMVSNDTQVRWFQAVDTTVRPGVTHHIHNGVSLWNSPSGLNIYVWGENDYLRAYRFNPSTLAFNTPAAAVGSVIPPFGMPGGMISVSANGSTAGTGIVWATMPSQGDANHGTVPGILRAFNAENLALLWESSSPGDDMMSLAKFNPPLVAGGRVYVPSFSNAVNVYGLRPGPTPPVTNGVYQVRTGTTVPAKCLDVSGGSTADGANVQQWDCNGSPAQQWQLSNIANNVYEIRSSTTFNECLDVNGGGTANGTNVQQWGCNGTVAQQWAIWSLGNGQYRLMPQTAANECLDVSGGAPDTGANSQEWTCHGTAAQGFTQALDNAGANPVTDGTYRIQTVVADKCVDVNGGVTDNGANVQQWTCNGSDAQRWRFRSLGNSLYEVRAAISDRCLDVSNGSAAVGANVQQWDCNGSPAQLWAVQALGDGQYQFLPQTGSGLCLDVSNGDTIDGTNIQQWDCNGSPAQQFRIINP
jgi:hypothetical protein